MNLPNKLTVARVIAVPIFIILYMQSFYLASAVLFVVASITDYFDGMLARKYNLISNFGKIMDPLADKILVYSALVLLVGDKVIAPWILAVILTREFTVGGMRTVAAADGIVIAAGISGKVKTVLQMIAVPILIVCRIAYTNIDADIMIMILDVLQPIGMWLFYISFVATIYSGIEYVWKNINVFKK